MEHGDKELERLAEVQINFHALHEKRVELKDKLLRFGRIVNGSEVITTSSLVEYFDDNKAEQMRTHLLVSSFQSDEGDHELEFMRHSFTLVDQAAYELVSLIPEDELQEWE